MKNHYLQGGFRLISYKDYFNEYKTTQTNMAKKGKRENKYIIYVARGTKMLSSKYQ